jgi:hypothetical protein
MSLLNKPRSSTHIIIIIIIISSSLTSSQGTAPRVDRLPSFNILLYFRLIDWSHWPEDSELLFKLLYVK